MDYFKAALCTIGMLLFAIAAYIGIALALFAVQEHLEIVGQILGWIILAIVIIFYYFYELGEVRRKREEKSSLTE